MAEKKKQPRVNVVAGKVSAEQFAEMMQQAMSAQQQEQRAEEMAVAKETKEAIEKRGFAALYVAFGQLRIQMTFPPEYSSAVSELVRGTIRTTLMTLHENEMDHHARSHAGPQQQPAAEPEKKKDPMYG